MSVAALSRTAPVTLESLTISRDVMPHHYIARAVILDLQPEEIVTAIIATEAAIRRTHPYMHRSGWSATSDGLRIYFHEWRPDFTAVRVVVADEDRRVA